MVTLRSAGTLALSLLPVAFAAAGELNKTMPLAPTSMRSEQIAALQRGAPPQDKATKPGGDVQLPPDAATPDCLARFHDLALPQRRGDEPDASPLICRRGYVLAYNLVSHDPEWVMEHLGPSDLKGPANRSNKFAGDPLLAGRDATNGDYLKSGFDRGHQAPAADAKFDAAVMDQSFYFSNMAPQIGIGFNRGAWKSLEELIRAWISCGGHKNVYVVTGPIFGQQDIFIGQDQVRVPARFFKVLYDVDTGRGFGLILPNRKIGSTIPRLEDYVVPIDEIETETGLAFFQNFTLRQQNELKSSAGEVWGHAASCPTT